MTDRLKQSISALIDGEASDIEVHRLLRQWDSDGSVKPAWLGYLQVRSVVQGEHQLDVASHLKLHSRICTAIEAEACHALKSGHRTPVLRTFAKPIAGLAVAASLAVAVMVGYYVQSPNAPTELVATSSPMAVASPVAVAPQVINVQPVSTAPVANLQGQLPDLRQLSEQQQRELRQYLIMHDQMARMDPNSRMASFENPNSNQ